MRRSTILLAAGLTGLAAAVLLPGLVIGPSLDAAVFASTAREVREGSTLYAEAWDHKPPGVYLLLAGLQAALRFVGAWAVSWVASVLALSSAGLLLMLSCERLGVRRALSAVVAAGAMLGMGQYLLALGGGLSETLAAPFLAGAVAVGLRSGTSGRGGPAAVGGLLSAAALVSLQSVPAALAVGGALVMAGRTGRQRLTLLASGLGGALLPALAALAWLAFSGALPAAWEAMVDYSAAYRQVELPGSGRLATSVLSWTTLALLYLVPPALLGLRAGLGAPGLTRLGAAAAAAWLVVSIAYLAFQGRFYAHYAIPLVIPLGVLAALGLQRMARDLARARRPLARALALLPALVGLAISVPASLAATAREVQPLMTVNRSSRAVGAEIRVLTAADERIWVWGNAPQVYLHADRRPGTPFSYLYPLTTPGYSTPTLVEQVRAELATHPPMVVVDAGSAAVGQPGFPQLLEPRQLAVEGRDLDLLDPLRAFVRERYVLHGVVEGWPVYRLRAP